MTTIQCKCDFCGKPLIRKVAPSIKSVHHFCDNKCKGNWQKTLKPVTRDWLYEHYITKGLNTTEIGHMVSRDPKSVWNWLKDFGIPIRPRGGHTAPGSFRKGDKNPFEGKKHTQETKDKIRAARLRDGRIPCMKDGVHWMKHDDYSKQDHPSWKGGCTPERQGLYSSKEWVEAVKAVWKRDKAICARCGKEHNTKEARGTFHIHHIVSFENKALRVKVNNLVLLCSKCHHFVHSKANVNSEFIKEIEK